MDEAEPEVGERPSLRKRYQSLIAEYGAIAVVTYLFIFACVLVGFAAAIQLGVRVEGASAQAGTWFSAWVATKVTQPLRIAATLALTPAVAGVWRRLGPAPRD
ncbi:MAG: hypothetical protein D6731_16100 [Planctomycetota bacterium]|nr:MAG: hypothetical protein D6731_16100 [Planctomycetota bacterium]